MKWVTMFMLQLGARVKLGFYQDSNINLYNITFSFSKLLKSSDISKIAEFLKVG